MASWPSASQLPWQCCCECSRCANQYRGCQWWPAHFFKASLPVGLFAVVVPTSLRVQGSRCESYFTVKSTQSVSTVATHRDFMISPGLIQVLTPRLAGAVLPLQAASIACSRPRHLTMTRLFVAGIIRIRVFIFLQCSCCLI